MHALPAAAAAAGALEASGSSVEAAVREVAYGRAVAGATQGRPGCPSGAAAEGAAARSGCGGRGEGGRAGEA